MTSVKQSYHHLISLTQLYLLREYGPKSMLAADPDSYKYLRKKTGDAAPLKNPLKPPPLNLLPQQPAPFQKLVKIDPPSNMITAPPPSSSSPVFAPPPLPLNAAVPLPAAPTLPPSLHSSNKLKNHTLEEMKPAQAMNHGEMMKQCKNLFPDLPLTDSVPSDSRAKRFKDQWLNKNHSPVLILSFQTGEKEMQFLKNITKAISLHHLPARLLSAGKIEEEDGWEKILLPEVKLILATDYDLYLHPKLMRYYEDNPKQGKHFLNKIPLLLLSELSAYFKNPPLKSLLWRAICNETAALTSSSDAH